MRDLRLRQFAQQVGVAGVELDETAVGANHRRGLGKPAGTAFFLVLGDQEHARMMPVTLVGLALGAVLADEVFDQGLRLDDFAAAQARGADAQLLGSALHLGAHRAQVDVPAPLGDIVGVADIVAELRPLAANITDLCHDCSESFQSQWGKT